MGPPVSPVLWRWQGDHWSPVFEENSFMGGWSTPAGQYVDECSEHLSTKNWLLRMFQTEKSWMYRLKYSAPVLPKESKYWGGGSVWEECDPIKIAYRWHAVNVGLGDGWVAYYKFYLIPPSFKPFFDPDSDDWCVVPEGTVPALPTADEYYDLRDLGYFPDNRKGRE
jgi:hypothetical protein